MTNLDTVAGWNALACLLASLVAYVEYDTFHALVWLVIAVLWVWQIRGENDE